MGNSGCGGLFKTRPCYVAQTGLKFVISGVSPFSVKEHAITFS